MNSVERILQTIDHQEPDRVPMADGFWPTTIERWHGEGLPENVPSINPAGKQGYMRPLRSTDVSPADYFGLEMVQIRADYSPRFPTELIDEGGDTVLERTPYGALRRQNRNREGIPEVVEWPIKSRDDWDRIKPRLQPDPSRFNWTTTRGIYESARQKGQFVVLHAPVGWAHYHEYIKIDELLMIMAVEPEWAKEMFQHQAELVMALAQIVLDEGIQFDGALLSCDLGYRNGTFFSPEMYRSLQFPFDQKVGRFFRDKGLPVILHSDGRVKSLIPQFLDAGVNVLNPIECKAGMDLVELKREYGRDLAFMGGIDVRAMANPDPKVIEEEIKRKFAAAMVDGGYIYHSDHSIPNNVSLQQYRRVLELVRHYGVYR
ncbi:MAG: uroporphyrinogen decarboxylase family protein [bacterium]